MTDQDPQERLEEIISSFENIEDKEFPHARFITFTHDDFRFLLSHIEQLQQERDAWERICMKDMGEATIQIASLERVREASRRMRQCVEAEYEISSLKTCKAVRDYDKEFVRHEREHPKEDKP